MPLGVSLSYDREMLIQRNIELAKKHIMVPPKSAKRYVIIITAIIVLINVGILGSSIGNPYALGAVIFVDLFLLPVPVALYLAWYLPVYRRSKAIVKMIDDGDLIAALNALTAMSAGSVWMVSIYATHYGAAKGYLEQAVALMYSESEKKEK